jgi:hypothetical protein
MCLTSEIYASLTGQRKERQGTDAAMKCHPDLRLFHKTPATSSLVIVRIDDWSGKCPRFRSLTGNAVNETSATLKEILFVYLRPL